MKPLEKNFIDIGRKILLREYFIKKQMGHFLFLSLLYVHFNTIGMWDASGLLDYQDMLLKNNVYLFSY